MENAEITSLKGQVASITEAFDDSQKEIKRLQDLLNTTGDRINELESEIEDLERDKKNFESHIDEVDKRIEELEELAKSFPKTETLADVYKREVITRLYSNLNLTELEDLEKEVIERRGGKYVR